MSILTHYPEGYKHRKEAIHSFLQFKLELIFTAECAEFAEFFYGFLSVLGALCGEIAFLFRFYWEAKT